MYTQCTCTYLLLGFHTGRGMTLGFPNSSLSFPNHILEANNVRISLRVLKHFLIGACPKTPLFVAYYCPVQLYFGFANSRLTLCKAIIGLVLQPIICVFIFAVSILLPLLIQH